MWIERLKYIANKRDYSLKDIAALIDMSEPNLYKCFKRGSIEVKYLEKLANSLGVPVTYFFEEEENTGQQVHAVGDQSIAIAANGKKNFFSRNKVGDRHAETAGEVNILNEKVKHLEQLLEEKERLLEEKERLIKVLMEKR